MKTRKFCQEEMPDPNLRFADIHCHPHMRSFNWLHKPWKPAKSEKYHPWWIILPKFKAADKGKRAAAYSQCDLAQVTNGNLKLAIVSLYPMEKGWVTGRKKPLQGRPVDLQKSLGNNAFNEIVSNGLSAVAKPLFKLMGKDKGGDPALRDFIQAIFMKLPLRKINFYQSDKYDYFKELKIEREYLLKRNGVESNSEIFVPTVKKLVFNRNRIKKKCPVELDATGTYVFAKNGEHAKEIIDSGKTAFIMSIEGANVFNSHEPVEEVKKKIMEVKGWDESLFFITFTHHFYNYLAGHAHSIPDVGTNLIDQDEGCNEGFTEAGREIIRLLLSIDKNNKKDESLGRRVLIDVKHLSVVARREFYDEIVKPCLKKGDVIPVIASHVAYSGVEKIQTMVDNLDKEVDGAQAERFGHKFNCWNINVCDEDILMIFKTGGLIGINLDQRVLGIAKEDQEDESKHILYVWQHIKSIMKAVLESKEKGLPPAEKVTDLVCLGTDFDGYIDPANKYATVIDFTILRKDLIETIKNDPEKDKLLFGLSPDEFAEKICFSNAMDFVLKNFK
jgi:microsomal dipeptidase-like Zn-dependent dipeptidase